MPKSPGYKQTNKPTNKLTNKQTNEQTNKQTHKQTNGRAKKGGERLRVLDPVLINTLN